MRAVALPAARDHKRLCDGDRGPEHRRHGRLLAAAGPGRRGGRGDPRDRPPADPGRDGPPRHPVPRLPVRGPDAHGRRPGAARDQRPPRRPGGAGDPAARRRLPWARCSSPPRRGRLPGGRPAAGPGAARAPPSASCWPPRAIPATRGAATRSTAWTRPAAAGALVFHAGHGGAAGPTAASGRTAAGCSRWSGAGADLGAARDAAERAADAITWDGLQRRHDIARRRCRASADPPLSPTRRCPPPWRPPDDPPLHAPRDGRRLVRAGALRADARGGDRGLPGPGPPRPRARRTRWRPSRRARSWTWTGSPRSSRPPTTTSSRSSRQVAETVGPEGRFLHLGLTSSDVVDTALALQLRAAGERLLGGRGPPARRADRPRPAPRPAP